MCPGRDQVKVTRIKGAETKGRFLSQSHDIIKMDDKQRSSLFLNNRALEGKQEANLFAAYYNCLL